MAFAASKSLTGPLLRLVSNSKSCQTKIRGIQTLAWRQPESLKHGHRSLTRSFGLLIRDPSKVYNTTGRLTKTCGCCGLHTKGDQELTEFLTEEIALEKKTEKLPGKLPGIKGFEIAESIGSEVKLVKSGGGETVAVRFNVNHSVDDDNMLDEHPEGEEGPPQMVSKPAFVVEISKGSAKTLHIQCSFPPEEMPPADEASQEEQEYIDAIEIQEVTLVDTGKEWGEKEFILSGSVMDGNLYDMLLNMMEERGIDGDFIDEFIDFSTAFEHRNYIGFLEQLKDFTSK